MPVTQIKSPDCRRGSDCSQGRGSRPAAAVAGNVTLEDLHVLSPQQTQVAIDSIQQSLINGNLLIKNFKMRLNDFASAAAAGS